MTGSVGDGRVDQEAAVAGRRIGGDVNHRPLVGRPGRQGNGEGWCFLGKSRAMRPGARLVWLRIMQALVLLRHANMIAAGSMAPARQQHQHSQGGQGRDRPMEERQADGLVLHQGSLPHPNEREDIFITLANAQGNCKEKVVIESRNHKMRKPGGSKQSSVDDILSFELQLGEAVTRRSTHLYFSIPRLG
jgi:hypothetical protein